MNDDIYCLQGDDPANDLPADTPYCCGCGDTTPNALSEWLDSAYLRQWVCDSSWCVDLVEQRGWVKR